MKKILAILLISTAVFSCHDIKIGYLETDEAKYVPDEMVLDMNTVPEFRIEDNIPWISVPIQGVQGTVPILYDLGNISGEDQKSIDEIRETVKLRGDGTFEIPLNNTIKSGEYFIGLKIHNKGYTHFRDSLFKIVVP